MRSFTAAVGIAMNREREIVGWSRPGLRQKLVVQGITPVRWPSERGRRNPLVNKAIAAQSHRLEFKMSRGSPRHRRHATRKQVVNVSPTVMTVSGFNFYDWRAHGSVDFLNAFAHASDIYFYTLAGGGSMAPNVRGAGPENIAKYARMLGFGQRTGIDLPYEVRGIMPDPTWKLENARGGRSHTYHGRSAGLRRGHSVQLMNAYAPWQGGTVYAHLMKEVRDAMAIVTQNKAPEGSQRRYRDEGRDLGSSVSPRAAW